MGGKKDEPSEGIVEAGELHHGYCLSCVIAVGDAELALANVLIMGDRARAG